MKGWTLSLAAALVLAGPAWAGEFAADFPAPAPARLRGKLDLDLFTPGPIPPRSPEDAAGLPLHGWVPGDPRDQRGEPRWVRHMSHLGYAGLGAAGLAASAATGGVAPAVGFGLVTLVQSYLEWREIKKSASGESD